MSRLLVALVALSSFAALAEDAPPAEGAKPKLTVVPFALLSSEVPARAGPKALGMLAQEFKSADKYVLVDVKRTNPADTFTDALTAARKSVDEAKELRAKKKFRLADEALTKAIKGYVDNAPGVTEVAEVVDALALQSAVQFNTGRDEDGAKSLNAALALAPERELPLAATSALFGRVVTEARKGIKANSKAQVLLESVPSNAPVFFDGVMLGATPIMVNDVPAGQHYWRALLPNGELVGGVVEVANNKLTKLAITAANKDPEARLLASLAQNKVDPDSVAAAKEAAKSAEADYVLFGALGKDGKDLTLHAFLLATASGEVRRLNVAKFDSELLSAGMEFYNLAGDVANKGAQVGESVKVPAAVAINTMSTGVPKLTEAKYGVPPSKDELGEDSGLAKPDNLPTKEEPKKPLGPRVPLKKK